MHQREMSLAPSCVGWRRREPSASAVAAVITSRATNRRESERAGVVSKSFMRRSHGDRGLIESVAA